MVFKTSPLLKHHESSMNRQWIISKSSPDCQIEILRDKPPKATETRSCNRGSKSCQGRAMIDDRGVDRSKWWVSWPDPQRRQTDLERLEARERDPESGRGLRWVRWKTWVDVNVGGYKVDRCRDAHLSRMTGRASRSWLPRAIHRCNVRLYQSLCTANAFRVLRGNPTRPNCCVGGIGHGTDPTSCKTGRLQ